MNAGSDERNDMGMRAATPSELERWDDLVWNNPGEPTFYQMRTHAELKGPLWLPRYMVHEAPGVDTVYVMYLVRSMPPFGELWYAPTGPQVRDATRFRQICADLRAECPAFAVNLEPNLPVESEADRVELIRSLDGMRGHPNLSMGLHTVFVDLRPSEDDILASFRQRTRRSIRKLKDAVVEHRTDEAAFDTMWQLYEETNQRAGIAIRSRAYHVEVWRRYVDNGQGHFVLARPSADEEVQAGAFLLCHRELGYYKDGGSLRTKESNGLQYLVQWESMRWCKEHGATVYDMYGAPPSWQADNEHHKLFPLVQFKTGFGEITDTVGTMQLVLKPSQFRAFDRVGMPLYRRLGAKQNPLFY